MSETKGEDIHLELAFPCSIRNSTKLFEGTYDPINVLTSTAVPLPSQHRHGPDHPQAVPQAHRAHRLRGLPLLRLAPHPGRPDAGKPDPSFVLNNPAYAGSQILIAERNFGCGSSREHAAWALNQYGFLAVIAPTFADIFFSNAGKNGIILVRLRKRTCNAARTRSTANPAHKLTINLEAQTVTDDQGFNAHFDIDPFRKYCLLNGLDDIGLTLRHAAALDTFESAHDKEFWSTPKLATA